MSKSCSGCTAIVDGVCRLGYPNKKNGNAWYPDVDCPKPDTYSALLKSDFYDDGGDSQLPGRVEELSPGHRVVLAGKTTYIKATVSKVTKTELTVTSVDGEKFRMLRRNGRERGEAYYGLRIAENYGSQMSMRLMTWAEADRTNLLASERRACTLLAIKIVKETNVSELAALGRDTLNRIIELMEGQNE